MRCGKLEEKSKVALGYYFWMIQIEERKESKCEFDLLSFLFVVVFT